VLGVVLGTAALTVLMAKDKSRNATSDWPMFGRDVTNTANNPNEKVISTKNVNQLKTKWTFTTGGDVSARAAVVDGVAYFPDWAGNLWAVDASSGSSIWSHQLSDYGLATGTVSRTSPAVADGVVYVGTQYVASAKTGWLLAIDAKTGNLNWKVQPDTSNSFPVITSSPAVAGGVVYVGMTSNEEFAAADPSYPCCSVRGSIVAVKASNGAVLWQTFTVPKYYSGGASWGSNPVVDTKRHLVYVGTGNNYSEPSTKDIAYWNCINEGGTEAQCISPNDHADSILALDMSTGAVKWATRLMTWDQTGVTNGSDSWNVSCFVSPYSNCPPPPTGPDYDFGSAPNEITYRNSRGKPVTIIGAGQKSGIYYALDPDTGAELWQTVVGPGSSLGGIEWGSASDDKRIYVAISNFYGIPYGPNGSWSAGSWAALNPGTGNIVWQVADPNGAVDLGPVSVANGVVYAASMAGTSTASTMFALDASSGKTLWSFAAGSSVNAGATIVDGTVYWGSGYAHLGIPGYTGNNQFFAFSINGQ
jgi:polyvinyl alcohol dehydrogenase (cytochrome)